MVLLAHVTDDDGIAGLPNKGLADTQHSGSCPRPPPDLPLVVSIPGPGTRLKIVIVLQD